MYKDQKTADPKVLVHITYSTQSDGRIRLRGYAMDSESKIKLDGARIVRRTATCNELIQATESQLVTAVMKQLAASSASKRGQKHSIAKKGHYTTPVSDIVTSILNRPEVTINPEKWARSTQNRALKHYQRNFIPTIESIMQLNGTVSSDDVDEYRSLLSRNALANGRSKGNPDTAATTSFNALYQDLVVHNWFVENHPELGLPSITYNGLIRTKKVQIEQAKSIPEEIRAEYVELLERSVAVEPCKVYCAVLMLDAALRTAEACAVSLDEIIFSGKVSKVLVLWQMQNGVRTEYMKTESSYRQVVLSYWGITMLLRCIDAMIDAGIVIDAEHPAIINHNELSAWVKQKLIACGLTEDFLSNARALQELAPDPDSTGKPIDICAYIQRRDRASRWRSICGLSADTVDYLLGHRRLAPVQPDYRLYDEQCAIAEQLERDVYTPEITLNPAYCPITLEGPMTLNRLPQQGYVIASTGPDALQVRITGTAEEPGSIGKILAPLNSWKSFTFHNHIDKKRRQKKHDSEENKADP